MPDHAMAHGHTAHDAAAKHGMLIVGDSDVLLSHLPMFLAPHDFQVLLQVRLREEGRDPTAVYREDRRRSGERIYTWVPKPFVLPDLLDAAGNVRSMQGTIFRGHFERGGTAITSDRVQADVVRVLYGRQFDPGDPRPPHLSCLLFGSVAEPFLAHLITRPPDYDQIASVAVEGLPTGWDGTALRLEIPDRRNTAEERLRAGEQVDAIRADDAGTGPLKLSLREEFYFETGDLVDPSGTRST